MDLRALNRATLHRQLLLQRRRAGELVETIEALGGLNAQQTDDPYIALHSRLEGFKLDELTAAIEDGRVVRSCLMRATQHLVSPADFAWLRPVLSPLLQRVQRNVFGRRTAGVDLASLVAQAREILDGRTLTRPELGRLLASRWPGVEASALAWSVQYLLPLTHPAPSGTWNRRGTVPVKLAEHRCGPPDPRRLVRRYLAAFGPATVADMRAWSGVAGLREVVAGIELVSLPGGLLDLPEAPRPDPATPAPVRLLAGFDNLLLAFADRGRIMTREVQARVCVGDLIEPTLLVDGMVCGTWSQRGGVVTITPFTRLSPAGEEAAIAEGQRMAGFIGLDPNETRLGQRP